MRSLFRVFLALVVVGVVVELFSAALDRLAGLHGFGFGLILGTAEAVAFVVKLNAMLIKVDFRRLSIYPLAVSGILLLVSICYASWSFGWFGNLGATLIKGVTGFAVGFGLVLLNCSDPPSRKRRQNRADGKWLQLLLQKVRQMSVKALAN